MDAFKGVCKKKSVNPEKCTVNMRGKHISSRKTPVDKIQTVINFINSVPQYESHYARNISQINKKYLAPDLNMTILYNEYKKMCTKGNLPFVSIYMFRDIFFRKFNLKFKRPLHTCDFCDSMKVQLKDSTLSAAMKISLT